MLTIESKSSFDHFRKTVSHTSSCFELRRPHPSLLFLCVYFDNSDWYGCSMMGLVVLNSLYKFIYTSLEEYLKAENGWRRNQHNIVAFVLIYLVVATFALILCRLHYRSDVSCSSQIPILNQNPFVPNGLQLCLPFVPVCLVVVVGAIVSLVLFPIAKPYWLACAISSDWPAF